jgi:drug/metabolite transporter (DMT)-like permease
VVSVSASRASLLGVACGIGAAACWAASFVATRHGLTAGLSPFDLLLHRYLWSGLLLLPVVMRGGVRTLAGVGWARGIALTVLGGGVFAIISYAGFVVVPLGHGGVIQPSCATLTGLLLATLVLHERMTAPRVIGALTIVGGVVIIGLESAMRTGLHGVGGDLIFVLTGAMFATFGMLLRLWQVPSWPAAAVVSVLSMVAVPVDLALGGFDRLAAVGWRENVLQALYLFARSIAVLGIGRASVFPSLVPSLVLLLGWLILGEQPTAIQFTGLVVALVGFQLAQRG